MQDINWFRVTSILTAIAAVIITLFVFTPALAVVLLLGIAVVTAVWAQTY